MSPGPKEQKGPRFGSFKEVIGYMDLGSWDRAYGYRWDSRRLGIRMTIQIHSIAMAAPQVDIKRRMVFCKASCNVL